MLGTFPLQILFFTLSFSSPLTRLVATLMFFYRNMWMMCGHRRARRGTQWKDDAWQIAVFISPLFLRVEILLCSPLSPGAKWLWQASGSATAACWESRRMFTSLDSLGAFTSDTKFLSVAITCQVNAGTRTDANSFRAALTKQSFVHHSASFKLNKAN